MIFSDKNKLEERVRELTNRTISGPLKIIEDTTQYMSIHGGMILRLDGNDYFVLGEATEGRFGIDDQPKFWVKYALDLESGARKIIKLEFYEEFTSRAGPFLIRGKRSPEKEKHVLEIVKGHPNFMQGYSVNDPAGNLVRIIDFVSGRNLYRYLYGLRADHETYFHDILPTVMKKLVEAFEAIDFLLNSGEHHGDIRTDHIFITPETKRYVWIDFDFHISHNDFDIWSLGDVLAFVIGKGAHRFQDIVQNPEAYPVNIDDLEISRDDGMLFFKTQMANLQKIFPYIPDKLNRILMNFSAGSYYFYDNVRALVDDIGEVFS